jgi:hypothetical protein
MLRLVYTCSEKTFLELGILACVFESLLVSYVAEKTQKLLGFHTCLEKIFAGIGIMVQVLLYTIVERDKRDWSLRQTSRRTVMQVIWDVYDEVRDVMNDAKGLYEYASSITILGNGEKTAGKWLDKILLWIKREVNATSVTFEDGLVIVAWADSWYELEIKVRLEGWLAKLVEWLEDMGENTGLSYRQFVGLLADAVKATQD